MARRTAPRSKSPALHPCHAPTVVTRDTLRTTIAARVGYCLANGNASAAREEAAEILGILAFRAAGCGKDCPAEAGMEDLAVWARTQIKNEFQRFGGKY